MIQNDNHRIQKKESTFFYTLWDVGHAAESFLHQRNIKPQSKSPLPSTVNDSIQQINQFELHIYD